MAQVGGEKLVGLQPEEVREALERLQAARARGGRLDLADEERLARCAEWADALIAVADRHRCVACGFDVPDALVLAHLETCPSVPAVVRAGLAEAELAAIEEVRELGWQTPMGAADAALPKRPPRRLPRTVDILPTPGSMSACVEQALDSLLGRATTPPDRRPRLILTGDELEKGCPYKRVMKAAESFEGAAEVVLALCEAKEHGELAWEGRCPWCAAEVERGRVDRHMVVCSRHPQARWADAAESWLELARGPGALPLASLAGRLQQGQGALRALIRACDDFSAAFGWGEEGAYVKGWAEKAFAQARQRAAALAGEEV